MRDGRGAAAAPGSVLQVANRVGRWAMVALIATILALAGGLAVLQHHATRTAAEIEAHRTAHVVATQYDWMFQAAAQALRRMSEVAAQRQSGTVVPDDIAEALRDLPAGLQHSLYDAEGRLLLTNARPRGAVNVADRDYFRQLRDGAPFVISPMITERLTGESVFILARRTGGPDSFTGVATIAVPVASLTDLADTLDFEHGSIISLVRDDGMLLARTPPMDPVDLSGAPLFRELERAPNGSFTGTSPADGEARIVGYWTLDGWPVIAVAALSEAVVYAAFRDRLEAELMIFAPLVVGLLVMTAWLWRLQARGERREAALVEANERADFLMKEIHHRVKNNLQTVMSLIRLERLPAEAKVALLGRIAAMAAVHQEIYSVGSDDTIPARRYLIGVIENVMRSYDLRIDLTAEISEIRLPGDRAMQLGMLVNEVVSNACKHAFRERRGGRLTVRLGAGEPGWMRLRVCDDGPGYDSASAEENMGSRLVDAFAVQLGGRIVRENHGGHCVTVDFPDSVPPVPERAAA